MTVYEIVQLQHLQCLIIEGEEGEERLLVGLFLVGNRQEVVVIVFNQHWYERMKVVASQSADVAVDCEGGLA